MRTPQWMPTNLVRFIIRRHMIFVIRYRTGEKSRQWFYFGDLTRFKDCSSLLATLDAKLARVNNVKVLRVRQVLGCACFGAIV
jgi:hypothetical protein